MRRPPRKVVRRSLLSPTKVLATSRDRARRETVRAAAPQRTNSRTPASSSKVRGCPLGDAPKNPAPQRVRRRRRDCSTVCTVGSTQPHGTPQQRSGARSAHTSNLDVRRGGEVGRPRRVARETAANGGGGPPESRPNAAARGTNGAQRSEAAHRHPGPPGWSAAVRSRRRVLRVAQRARPRAPDDGGLSALGSRQQHRLDPLGHRAAPPK
jgi:hypothetical protein